MRTLESPAHPLPGSVDAAPCREPFGALAAYIQRTAPNERAALARLQPDALKPHQLAALARALMAAGLSPEQWRADTWPRWALVAHGMALAGHDDKQKFGKQLAQAGVSESRVTKLLTSRGNAFTQLVPRILRLLASKGVVPNWRELGELVLKENSSQRHHQVETEQIRLQIAGPYFSAMARVESTA